MAVIRNQTFHEILIPLLVEGVGARSYLELGTHQNETIRRVVCEKRYGVDISPVRIPGALFFEMTTDDFIKEQAKKHGPFDFVFIDADHSFESARKDFYGIWPMVSKDGLILLHDTNPETIADTEPGLCGDSWKLAKTLTDAGHECVTLPYHPGLTIVRKRREWGPAE